MHDGGINFQQKISLSQPINQLLNLLSKDMMRVCVCETEGNKREHEGVCLSGIVKKSVCVCALANVE